MSRADWASRIEHLHDTRAGLLAQLEAEPQGPNAWQLRRDVDATDRAIAFAESKLRGTAGRGHHTKPKKPAMAKPPLLSPDDDGGSNQMTEITAAATGTPTTRAR